MRSIALLGCGVLLASCVAKDQVTPFRSLQPGMTTDQVRLRYGPPDEAGGERDETDLYRLDDGTDVVLSFKNGHLTSAKRGDEDLMKPMK